MQVIQADPGFEEAKQAQSVFSEVLYLPIYPLIGSHGYQRLAQLIEHYYLSKG